MIHVANKNKNFNKNYYLLFYYILLYLLLLYLKTMHMQFQHLFDIFLLFVVC